MRNSTLIRWPLFILLALAVITGCSSRFDPVAPMQSGEEDLLVDGDEHDAQILSPRSSRNFQTILKDSQHENYAEISCVIDGSVGGSISGTVAGYESSFSLAVPAGAYQGLSTLSMLVPTDGIAVYQLLPHTEFDEDVTVTLDYSKWIEEGAITDGSTCEIFYMNEETEEFEQLSPRAVFVADGDNPTVTFTTDHFSRWWVEGDVE